MSNYNTLPVKPVLIFFQNYKIITRSILCQKRSCNFSSIYAHIKVFSYLQEVKVFVEILDKG